jgi:putative ABC transport system substrate-binding protein
LDRRAFFGTLAGSLLAAPLAAKGQRAEKTPRVGVISERSPSDPFAAAFRQGLRDLGYVEGRNVVVEMRYAQGALERVPKLAAELVRQQVDVLVVGGTVSAQSAKTATAAVPIVFALAGDPVGSGLVASFSHPGSNVTGISNLSPGLLPKQLELLRAAAPKVSRVTILYNPVNPATQPALDETNEAARAMGVEVQILELRRADELASAFATLTRWHAGGLLAVSDPVVGNHLAQLSKQAARHRLPAMYSRREFVEAGGLMAYGPSYEDNYRRAATYVDKILKGAKPADLPVEQPTKFELVINLKTAKTLGLTIPPSLLQRADQVIE